MALDLLRNDEELHDLFSYGIEGEHYIDLGNGKIELTENNSNCLLYTSQCLRRERLNGARCSQPRPRPSEAGSLKDT